MAPLLTRTSMFVATLFLFLLQAALRLIVDVADKECPTTFVLRHVIQDNASTQSVMTAWFNQAMAVRNALVPLLLAHY